MPALHRVALLGNPAAGRGRGARLGRAAHARLSAAGVEVVSVEGADAVESLDLARAAVDGGVDALVAVGGDGTVNLALRALEATPTPLGLVPAGSGNDGARSLGVPVGEVDAAVDRVLAGLAGGARRTVDLAACGGRRFLTVLAAGFDAVVTERAASMTWPRGEARYSLAVLAELRTLAPISYALDLDGDVRRLDATLVAVGNGPSFGGGLRITHGARLDDGLLDVVVVKPIGRVDLVWTYPRLRTGTHVRHRQYERHRVRRVTVAAPGVVGHADGERFGALPLTIEVRPRALTVLG